MQLKHVLTVALVFVMAFTLCVPVFAAEPRLNNVGYCMNDFYLQGSELIVYAYYNGYEGVTTSATVDIEIERKGIFGIWSDVSGGSWSESFSGIEGDALYSVSVSKTGEYRAKITWTFYGTGGSPDTVTETLYCEYE